MVNASALFDRILPGKTNLLEAYVKSATKGMDEGKVPNADKDKEEKLIQDLNELKEPFGLKDDDEEGGAIEDDDMEAPEAPTAPEPEENEEDDDKDPEAEEGAETKQYFGKKGDNFLYMVTTYDDAKDTSDLQIVDQEGDTQFSAAEHDLDSNDILAFVIASTKELEPEEVSYEIFTKYVLPEVEKDNDDEEEGLEDELSDEVNFDADEDEEKEDEFMKTPEVDKKKSKGSDNPFESRTKKNKAIKEAATPSPLTKGWAVMDDLSGEYVALFYRKEDAEEFAKSTGMSRYDYEIVSVDFSKKEAMESKKKIKEGYEEDIDSMTSDPIERFEEIMEDIAKLTKEALGIAKKMDYTAYSRARSYWYAHIIGNVGAMGEENYPGSMCNMDDTLDELKEAASEEEEGYEEDPNEVAEAKVNVIYKGKTHKFGLKESKQGLVINDGTKAHKLSNKVLEFYRKDGKLDRKALLKDTVTELKK